MVSLRAGQNSLEKCAFSCCEGAEEMKFKEKAVSCVRMKNRVTNWKHVKCPRYFNGSSLYERLNR